MCINILRSGQEGGGIFLLQEDAERSEQNVWIRKSIAC